MSLAAYMSGITLANAGLGLVHGFASPVGGFFNIPHGVVCSSLMAASNKITIRKLRSYKGNPQALQKYATVGRLFSTNTSKPDDFYIDALVNVISTLCRTMNIPLLSHYGVTREHYQKIVHATGSKNNPIPIDKAEMFEVLELSETI